MCYQNILHGDLQISHNVLYPHIILYTNINITVVATKQICIDFKDLDDIAILTLMNHYVKLLLSEK